MVNVIRLNGDPHAQAQRLLPWYVTGSIDAEEAAQVEAHLNDCAECHEDLEAELALARQVKTLPSDEERGWAGLKARVQDPSTAKRDGFFGRRVPLGWALAAQAASLAILVTIVAFALVSPKPLYRTLGSAPTAESGNLVVIFKPETPERTLRATLMQNGARIVDGPTSTDAYVLHATAARRAEILARLRASPDISLAEPIDGDSR
jgi:Putative zinc-finger